MYGLPQSNHSSHPVGDILKGFLIQPQGWIQVERLGTKIEILCNYNHFPRRECAKKYKERVIWQFSTCVKKAKESRPSSSWNCWLQSIAILSSLSAQGFLIWWCFSVTQPCLSLCDSMDCSLPGFPVHHHFPEPFLYSSSVYSCHLVLISSASVRSIPFTYLPK